MGKIVTIDPITRIEGHLKIDIEVANGKVTNAWSSGTMFRGIELILQGRDPREAWMFTQRFCGVCTTVHAIASVRSVENALKLEIPKPPKKPKGGFKITVQNAVLANPFITQEEFEQLCTDNKKDAGAMVERIWPSVQWAQCVAQAAIDAQSSADAEAA